MLTDEKLLRLNNIDQDEKDQILQYLVNESLALVTIEKYKEITADKRSLKTLYNHYNASKLKGITICGVKFVYVNWAY